MKAELNPWPKKKFWCYTAKTLDEIVALMERPISMSDWNYDNENVWEWYEGEDHLGREWNISRKHLDVISTESVPTVFMAHPYPDEPSVFGLLISRTLNEVVFYGDAMIGTDDTYKLINEKEFRPKI